MKNILLTLFMAMSIASFGQTLNKYKYAVVPSNFAFLDAPDQYRMNTFTKMFMEKYGFTTFMSDEILPAEVASNSCNRVYVDVISSSTLFTTKLNVVLRDCTNAVIYTSPTGESREKDNKIAYPKALREAFNHFDKLNYKYDDAAAPATEQVTAATKNPFQSASHPTSDTVSLTARSVNGGYNVLDARDQLVLKLRNTSAEGVFIAERDGASGIFFNKMGKWYFEYYRDGKLVSEILEVKFQ